MGNMYVVGKISDKGNEQGGYIFTSATYSGNIPKDEAILSSITNQFGGVESDYAIFKLNSESADGKRIVNGDEFSLVFDDTNVITNISFVIEDSKKWINVTISKNVVKKDGADYLTITTNMIKADGSNIDTDFNESVLVDILTPAGVKPLLAKFTAGVCEYPFQPADHTNSTGRYKIPAGKVDGYRIEKYAEFVGVIPVG